MDKVLNVYVNYFMPLRNHYMHEEVIVLCFLFLNMIIINENKFFPLKLRIFKKEALDPKKETFKDGGGYSLLDNRKSFGSPIEKENVISKKIWRGYNSVSSLFVSH